MCRSAFQPSLYCATLYVTGDVVHVQRQCAQNTPGRVITMQLCEHCNLMIPRQVDAGPMGEEPDVQWELVDDAGGVIAPGGAKSPAARTPPEQLQPPAEQDQSVGVGPSNTASSSSGSKSAGRGYSAPSSGNPKALERSRDAGAIALGQLPKSSPSPEPRP